MTRNTEICHTILNVLNDCGSHALPESTLKSHLDLRIRPKTTAEEFGKVRDWLKDRGCIKPLPDQFGGDEQRWLITESGQVMLAQ